MFAVGRSLLAFGRYGEQSGSNVDISSGQFMTDPQVGGPRDVVFCLSIMGIVLPVH
jgi:hypothetical protein